MISDTVIADTSEPCPTRRAGACATVRARRTRGRVLACLLSQWLPVRASQPALEAGARSH